MMQDFMNLCRWPELAEPYDQALKAAVAYILDNFEVLGILVTGTIVRGNPSPNSDLDICVLHGSATRQRIQKFFNGVPTEIFLNPPNKVEEYFQEERGRGRPCTAHMWATGFVILDSDPVVQQIRQRAEKILAQPPNPQPQDLIFKRYAAADAYENAQDIRTEKPAGALMMLNLAVHQMLQYIFWEHNRYLPRDKDLLAELETLDTELAELAHDYFTVADIDKHFMLAEQIADLTIGVRGFFEWESPLEDV
jgi:predicted nucleotidyltransferase